MTTTSDRAKVIPGPGSQASLGDRSIGALLIDAGKITAEDGERVLRFSKDKGLRFGDAAVELKLVSKEDVQQFLSRQFDYPYLLPGESQVSKEVVSAWAPFSPQVEALRALRSQLMLRWFTGGADRRLLSIVSAAKGEGRSYLAANLAVVFSQMGERTLLIDADLRDPKQHDLFGLKNTAGLSTVISERTGLEGIQRIPSFVDLSVLPSGPTPPNPLELLGRQSFGKLLKDLSEQFDVVIIDTPAASAGSDFQLVASKCQGALVVARKNKSTVAGCVALADAIYAARATVVGSVLNSH